MNRATCLAVIAFAAGAPLGAGSPAPFTEEAVARGLVYTMQNSPQSDGYLGFGCGFADLDADGDADVVVLGASDGRVGIFENNGAGQFTSRSLTSGIAPLSEASGWAAADVDGDGRLDLYLTQVGQPNSLRRNLGQFQFADVTATAGVGDAGAGKGVAFGDYDGDGRIDLYVCNYNGAAPGTEDMDNRLYRNLGSFQFQDVSVAQTVDDPGYSFEAVWTDFDRDGDADLYLSNDRGFAPPLFRSNQLWRNDGGQLVNISVGSGADVAIYSMGIAAGDFDGNRWPDLYVTNIHSPGGYNGFNNLLLNQGDGTFVESSTLAGVGSPLASTSWGAIMFDWDNDGHQDLYVSNQLDANQLYDCDGAFPCAEIAASVAVTGGTRYSFSAAVADVDGDGDLDLLENDLSGNVALLINHEGSTRSWVEYRVIGRGGDPWAIGASVDSRVGATWRLREVLAGGNGYLGQNDLALHVGLGTATGVDEVVVSWPGGTTTRTLTGLAANQRWTLYPPERLGDIDGDGACRRRDFATLAVCHLEPFEPGCEGVDFDGDSDVDGGDSAAFFATYDDPQFDLDDNAVHDLEQILANPLLDLDLDGLLDAYAPFSDDFETGNLARWDFTQPI